MAAATARADWYTNTANQTNVWLYRQMITVNHASVSGTQTDFPILVKITGSSNPLFSKAQSTGNDILFTQADGSTKITHEVEYYSSSAATLCAWVRMPSVSSAADTVAYMYYGCANAAAQGTSDGTWDSNFIMVHHLKETSGHHLDSTANFNDSTFESLAAQGTQVGTIDGADTFNGTSNYVTTTTTSATISAGSICILADGTATNAKTYMSGCYTGSFINRIYLLNDTGSFEAIFSGTTVNTGFNIPLNTWHYYALTWSSTTAYIVYVDGVAKASGTAATALTAMATSNKLGIYPDLTGKWWTGKIDEFRWSNVQRSASWLLTEWNTMSSPATFITLSTEEPRPSVTLIGQNDNDLRRWAEYIRGE